MTNHHDNEMVSLKEITYKPVNHEFRIQELKPNSTKKRDTFFLYFSVLTVNLLMIVNGSSLVWTSPVIPQLESTNPEINPLGEKITTFQISILVGLPSLFTIFGSFFFGKLPDVIGRKNTLICISLGTFLSNVAVAFGKHIYLYYAGRSIANLCLGLLFVVLPIYLNEICEDHNRAKHGCLMMFFLPFGSLYGYLLGPITSIKLFTLLCAAPLIPQLIFLWLLIPETPVYTASKGEKGATMKILRKLRSNKTDYEIREDYNQIEAMLKANSKADRGGFKNIFETRASRKGFIVGLGCCLSIHMSGVPVIMGFLGPIFNDAGTNLSGNMVAILVGCVKLLFFFVTITIVGRFGRRPLLLLSSIGTAIPLGVLAVHFYLNSIHSPMIVNIRWLPVACVLIYIAIYSLGLGSIATSLLTELFPNNVRAIATSVIMTIGNTLLLLLTTGFPIVSHFLGVHYCIGIFSVSCVFSFIFIYYMLPETKGKSTLEIQEILSK
ncbi:facilitated trehalose transporter Tret1-2 homolog [Leptinotarsa decemlineata]|uniref:facilitated trehalose transporter Tret1-2 homolog n=1 Tax=Leptinotarsa decemlineata TaxID=7539 RepID=UPI003D30B63E